ncbi:HAD-IIA family hydrolase [Nocardioides mesophilus]|uniref:HAD-IIA family hydrolase n=1 Tax=Nocardioides mesophilus TaxID=433659 RepID=A0A7G9RAI9_9ACTN|nr:HAD-IIA family hydrolase [Nocardioides mesophilus]QNN52614.1 HAD-IIA family hydrolase [Nocardioides mesophilus]
MLHESEVPLWDHYDVALLDLDGVVYVGPDAVPDAPEHLGRAAAAGMRLAYVTNNAARPPRRVAEHLQALGVPAREEDVVTSAQAAARLLADRCRPGDPVYVIGGEGLFEALTELGLRPVQSPEDAPVAVVSGYHRDLRWGTVTDGAILVASGLPWVASNTDVSVPTPHGPGPGNGVLVEAVARFTGRSPEVAGKPMPPLFEETVRRVGGQRPLVVGDRLDTDIEGAARSELDSLLVLTGVTGLPELVAAAPQQRPTYLSLDLGGLGEGHPRVEADADGTARLGGWHAEVRDGAVRVAGDGDAVDWWRTVAVVAWRHLDATGERAAVDGLRVPGSVSDGAAGDQPGARPRVSEVS